MYADKYNLPDSSVSVALKIMRCESGIRPDEIGKNYRNGKLDSRDWGYWQINDKTWMDYFATRGLDISNPEHNLEAGFIIMSLQGVKPWSASAKCHKFV